MLARLLDTHCVQFLREELEVEKEKLKVVRRRFTLLA